MNPILAILIYLAPSLLAFVRGHKNLMPILLLNIVTGLTIAGWFISLIWALTSNTEKVVRVKVCDN